VGGAQKLLNDKLAAMQGLHFHAIINSKPRKTSVLHVATHNCERCCPRLSHKEMSDAVIVMVKTISAAASQLWTVTSLHNLLWSHAGDLLCGLTTTLPSDVLEKLRSSHGWTCCGALLYHAPDDVCKSCPPRGADPPRCHPSCRVSRSGGPAWPTNIVLRLAHHPVVVPQFSSLRCAYEWLGERASAVAPNAVALVQRAAGRGEVAVPSRHFLPAPTGPAGEMFVGPYAVGGASWPPSLPASWVRLVPEETQDVWRAIKKLHGRASLARRVCRSIMLACASALRLARSSGWRCVDGAVFGQWQRRPKTLVARSARDLLADAGIPARKAQGFAATTLEALLCVLRARGAGSFFRSPAPVDDDLIPLVERMMPDEPTVHGLVQCEEADYVSGGEDQGRGCDDQGPAANSPPTSPARSFGDGSGLLHAIGLASTSSTAPTHPAADGGQQDEAADDDESVQPGDDLEDDEPLGRRTIGMNMYINVSVYASSVEFLADQHADPPVLLVHGTTPKGVRGILTHGTAHAR